MTTLTVPDVIHETDCRKPATHWSTSKCCGELLLILCGACKTNIASDCNPWHCPRCGLQWAMHAEAFRWAALYRVGGKP